MASGRASLTPAEVGKRVLLVERLEPDGATPYDLLICSLGYETRSRFVLERLWKWADRAYVSAFNSRQVLAFRDNLEVAAQLGSHVEVESDEEFGAGVSKTIGVVAKTANAAHIAFDISSSSRLRIASVVNALHRWSAGCELTCDFYYSPALFRPPETGYRAALAVAGPVCNRFAGETLDPRNPVAVLIGLGYEGRQALGAIQYLESDEVWAWFPRSADSRYDEYVQERNSILLAEIDPQNVIDYDVSDPFRCFQQLESVVHFLIDNSRPVAVPFGPKVFAAVTMLVSIAYDYRVPVWRFSPGQEGIPIDAMADGTTTGIRATFRPHTDKPHRTA